MATYYAMQQIGVADGTKIPPNKADGREVNAKKKSICASKPGTQAYANGDKVYLGKLKPGEKIVGIYGTTDTTWSTTTLSIGTLAAPTKYVNAKTLTVTDVPTALGPNAAAMDDAPSSTGEDLYLTLGVGGIGAAVLTTIEIETIGG